MQALGMHPDFTGTRKSASQQFWVSHHRRCLSFHEQAEHNHMEFSDGQSMWDMVFQLLERGYRVQ